MVQNFKIPWGSWYDSKGFTLELPDSWNVHMFNVNDTPEIRDPKDIEKALRNPHGTPTIPEIAEGKKNAVIVVDDISRHTRAEQILLVVLKQLNDSGISDDNITIISALGAHRPMTRDDFVKKIGLSVLERVNVQNHNPFLNLVNVGESKLGTPIFVNKTYYEAELKITISGIVPHNLAGFGGGAKIILPGVCGLKTLEENHRAGMRGIGIGLGYITDLRKDIEDVCTRVGLDFSINVVSKINGGIAGIFAGHFIDAHRKAIELFKKIYDVKITPEMKFDVGFFNSYPEDTELSQSVKSLNTYLLNPKVVNFKGAVVMLSASPEGRGYHALNAETGSPLYQNYGDNVLWKSFGKRNVWLFSPNVTRADVYHYYPNSINFEKDFKKLVKRLEETIGSSATACIFPCSAQIPVR